MRRVAIVSDSHVPSREPGLPGWVERRIAAADHALHAGDLDSPETLETLGGLADGLTAVAGNADPPSVGLPAVASADLGGVEFVVTHGVGGGSYYRSGVVERVREAAGNGTAVGVSGHTHEVHDFVEGGVRFLNPGSCTGAWPADAATMMEVTVAGGDLSVETIEGSPDG